MKINRDQWHVISLILTSPNVDMKTLVRLASLSPLDFRHADLRGVDFGRMNLDGYDFTGANLSNANLKNAKIGTAIFFGAKLDGADLTNQQRKQIAEYNTTRETDRATINNGRILSSYEAEHLTKIDDSNLLRLIRLLGSSQSKKRPASTYRNEVNGWLNGNSGLLEAWHIFRAWTNAHGPIDNISSHMLTWLSVHSRTQEAHIVLSSWLKGGGDINKIREYLLRWLHEWPTLDVSGQLIVQWMGRKGDFNTIEDACDKWIRSHANLGVAGSVYRVWLEGAKKAQSEIADLLLHWITKHGKKRYAHEVYSAWLEAGGNPKLIRQSFINWLAAWPDVLEASSAIEQWLRSGVDISDNEIYIEKWVDRFGSDNRALNVYCAWFDSGHKEGARAVYNAAVSWVNKSKDKYNSSKLLSSMARAGTDLSPLRNSIIRLFPKQAEHIEDGEIGTINKRTHNKSSPNNAKAYYIKINNSENDIPFDIDDVANMAEHELRHGDIVYFNTDSNGINIVAKNIFIIVSQLSLRENDDDLGS